jgi:hypothetical protein
MAIVTHQNRLEVLGRLGRCIRFDLDTVCSPYWDGRIPEGDTRSDDLRSATADLLAAVDRLEAQARADLEDLEAQS